MARFKLNQKIVCVKETAWVISEQSHVKNFKPSQTWGPKYGDIVTVSGFEFQNSITLLEWPFSEGGRPASFNENRFAPLMDISELTAILESEPIENLNIP